MFFLAIVAGCVIVFLAMRLFKLAKECDRIAQDLTPKRGVPWIGQHPEMPNEPVLPKHSLSLFINNSEYKCSSAFLTFGLTPDTITFHKVKR